jgi:hypothetical protein
MIRNTSIADLSRFRRGPFTEPPSGAMPRAIYGH